MYYNSHILSNNYVSRIYWPHGTTNNFEYIVNHGKRNYYVEDFVKGNLKLWQKN